MSKYSDTGTNVCVPSTPHESASTPGQQHVDFQHKIIHENGYTESAGRCEGNQHITEPSLVAEVWRILTK